MMTPIRKAQTATLAAQRPAVAGAVQRRAAAAAPPGRALQGALGNHATQRFVSCLQRKPAVAPMKGNGGSPPKPKPSPGPTTATTPQALLIDKGAGPTAGDCGGYGWTISWLLAKDSVAGGHIIQHIRVDYDIRNFLGWDLTTVYVKKKHWDYWEAWPVKAGEGAARMVSPTPTPTPTPTPATAPATKGGKPAPPFPVPYSAGSDQFSDPDSGVGTKGKIDVTGEAQFYEGVVTLPPDFIYKNPDTEAGAAPSTTKDPKLSGGTAKVDHNLSVEWSCLFTKSKTKIVSHTP